MPRIRITSTADTSNPKVVHVGTGIVWYAYLRSPLRLCVQREVNGVRDPEVEIAAPVSSFDVVDDPVDTTKGWIYFVHDGVVVRCAVTPLNVVLNAVAYLRFADWYNALTVDRGGIGGAGGPNSAWTLLDYPPLKQAKLDLLPVSSRGIGGTGGMNSTWTTNEGPDAPTVALERTKSPAEQIKLIVTEPNRTLYLNRGITGYRVYKKETELAGWVYFATIPASTDLLPWEYPYRPKPSCYITLTAYPVTYWMATSARTGYLPSESLPSNLVKDDGNLPIVYLDNVLNVAGGAGGPNKVWDLLEYPPVKHVRADALDVSPRGIGGAGGPNFNWTLNGTSIVNP